MDESVDRTVDPQTLREDRTRDDARCAEGVDDVAGFALLCPGADDVVQLVLIAAPGNVIGEPVIGDQVGSFHGLA